jgi:hypothetical protein
MQESISGARRLSIDEHAKSHGSSSRCRSHDEMKIAGVTEVTDPNGLSYCLIDEDGALVMPPGSRPAVTALLWA